MQSQAYELKCSSDIFQLIQNDPEYRNRVTEDFIQSHPSDLGYNPQIIITEISPYQDFEESELFEKENYDIDNIEYDEALQKENDDPEILSNIENGTDLDNDVWLSEPTKFFISCLEDMLPKVGKTLALKTKTKMWEKIHQEMVDKGYRFTLSQVKGKFRSLERSYKRAKLHNSKTGRNKATCPYESELDKVFGKRRALHPEFIIHNRDIEGKTRKQLVGGGASQNIPSSSGNNSGCISQNIPSSSGNNSGCISQNNPSSSENNSGGILQKMALPSTNASAMERESCLANSDDEPKSPVKRTKKKSSNEDNVFKRLDEIAQERRDYHSHLKRYLDSKEEREKEMLELLKKLLHK